MDRRSYLCHIPLPLTDKEECCYNCEFSCEDEPCDGNWYLYCIKQLDNKDGNLVYPSECCDKFVKYKKY